MLVPVYNEIIIYFLDEDYFTQLDKLPNTNNLMHPYSFNILGDGMLLKQDNSIACK